MMFFIHLCTFAVYARLRGPIALLYFALLIEGAKAADSAISTATAISKNSAFIEKHLESRLPELSLSTVHDSKAAPVSISLYLDGFLQTQVQAVNRTGWKVHITRGTSPASGVWPLSSRPDPATKTVRIAVTSDDISKLPSHNNFAFSYFWLGLLHELENARHASEFVRLSNQARSGGISRRAFVEREITLECHSFTRALHTYRQVLIPLVKQNSGVNLDDFSSRWPQRLSPRQARHWLNWSPIETHYSEWYDKVAPAQVRP